MEDFHKRSINTSRGVAGSNAFRTSDCDGGSGRPIGEHDNWDPEFQDQPQQPDWDAASIYDSPRTPGGPNSPGMPSSPGQWSQGTLTPGQPPRIGGGDGRRGSFSTDVSENEGDYFRQERGSMDNRQEFGNFLDRANKTIAKDHKHAADPFLDAAPSRPFGAHSRVSSVESIASIVDEKQNSPLNKAIVDVSLVSR